MNVKQQACVDIHNEEAATIMIEQEESKQTMGCGRPWRLCAECLCENVSHSCPKQKNWNSKTPHCQVNHKKLRNNGKCQTTEASEAMKSCEKRAKNTVESAKTRIPVVAIATNEFSHNSLYRLLSLCAFFLPLFSHPPRSPTLTAPYARLFSSSLPLSLA